MKKILGAIFLAGSLLFITPESEAKGTGGALLAGAAAGAVTATMLSDDANAGERKYEKFIRSEICRDAIYKRAYGQSTPEIENAFNEYNCKSMEDWAKKSGFHKFLTILGWTVGIILSLGLLGVIIGIFVGFMNRKKRYH